MFVDQYYGLFLFLGQTTSNECRRPPPTPVHFNVKLTTFIDVDALHIIVFDKVRKSTLVVSVAVAQW